MKVCIRCNRNLSLDNFYRGKKYYQSTCKDCDKLRNSAWSKQNPEKRYATQKKFRIKHRNKFNLKAQHILDGMRARSRKKGFDEPEFNRSEIEIIIDGGFCCKTGIPFEFSQDKYHRSPWTPVPDRIDSSKGYYKDNVQWVCHMYNSMKQEFREKEVELFINALLDRI